MISFIGKVLGSVKSEEPFCPYGSLYCSKFYILTGKCLDFACKQGLHLAYYSSLVLDDDGSREAQSEV